MLIIAIKGIKIAVSAFEKYKEKRRNAIWDFYTDLGTFLHRLRITIGSKDNPSNITKYLYIGVKPTGDIDKLEFEIFLDLAKNFLHFLSTGTGQVPATDNFDEWRKNRIILIEFLNTVLYIGVRIDIVDADAKTNIQEEALKDKINVVLETIDFFEKGINDVIYNLKKEIDDSKKKNKNKWICKGRSKHHKLKP